MQKIFIAAIIFSMAALFSSCGVPKNFQHSNYFQDSITEAAKTIINKPIVIEPGDRVAIDITAINKEAAAAFTIPASSAAQTQTGYLVDTLGNIDMLQLGIIHVGGLTTDQVKARLEDTLANYLKGAVVNVTIANFKVSVLGEVGTPGVLNVPTDKITVLDAIVQSGDLKDFGNRENILVIREENGKREFGRVNMNSNSIFQSPYYYLKQNDIVYVEAQKEKFINNDPKLNRNLRNLAIATTLLTTALLVVNLFK